jgi:hypothetical protein
MPPTTDDLAEADDEVWASLLHGDADAIEAIADPEATIHLPALGASSMEELLAGLRTGRLRVREVEIQRRRLRITGELATTDTAAIVAGTHGGAPFRTRLRWIRTWRIEAAWVLIAASSSPLRERG